MKRVGIELSSTHCRLVEATPRRKGARENVRVRTFASIAYDDPESLTRELRALVAKRKISRHAWVTVWGLRSAHQLLLLPPAKPADLDTLARREARRDLAILQVEGQGGACGVAVGNLRQLPAAGQRREVLVAAASSDDVRRLTQPIADAGFVIDGVVTPALALAALARLRHVATPDAPNAYVAIHRGVTGLAIVRDGLVLFAREMPWGYSQGASPRSHVAGQGSTLGEAEPYRSAIAPGEAFDRDAFGSRLAAELRRSFLFFKQTFKADVAQVVTCGDLPNLRSITAPLISALDLEVETVDSMDGIDATALPAPSTEFREQIPALRLAWALASDPAPPINLLPADVLAARAAARQRRVAGGAMAAAVMLCALLFWQADAGARARQLELRRAEQELAVAEPQARAFSEARERQAHDEARLAALDAFASQGPRLARALEVISRATPDEIVLNALKIVPAGAFWRATISGVAVTADPALAQAAVNRYLRDLQESPYLGQPVRSPALRMTTGVPQSGTPEARTAPVVPAGMSGIEFSVEFEIHK